MFKINKKILFFVVIFNLCFFSFDIFAGEWVKDQYGWKYKNDDGSYQNSGWFKDKDKKFYYFNSFGYVLTNGITPDGGKVGADGSWIVDPALSILLNEEEIIPNYKIEISEFETLYAGENLPAGDYMLFVNNNSNQVGKGYYNLGNKEPVRDIIPYQASFIYNSIVRLYNSEYINIVNSIIVPLNLAQKINYKKAEMFLVGFNLAPGQYMVETINNDLKGTVRFLSEPRDNGYSTRQDNQCLIKNEDFYKYKIIDVLPGQYIKMINSRLVK